MKASLFHCFSGIFLVLVWVGREEFPLRAEPFIPSDDQQVLERLPTVPLDFTGRKLRELRSRLAAEPDNLGLAVECARRCIERGRVEGDPRYLGQAQSALAPWWNVTAPPVPALVLRATIKQSLHEFPEALADLDQAVRLAPSNPQAWLTRATILAVLGRFDEARRACVPLLHSTSDLVALTAAANVASLTGQAERACQSLRDALVRQSSSPVQEREWALTVLAETEARIGRATQAERSFREALSLGRRDPYLLGAFADFLLEQQRPKEAASLLNDETRVDALLLRLALAESEMTPRPSSFVAHMDALRARFEASRLRGNRVHQREEARFTLHLLHRPSEALTLAQANWQVQREPADIRILLETALAANDLAAAAPALDFVRTNRLADVVTSELASELSRIAQK